MIDRGLGPVILCGHSERTALAPLIAKARPGSVEALVLICPYVERGRDILMRQARQQDAALRAVPGWQGRLARAHAWIIGWPSTMQRRFIRRLAATSSDTLKVRGREVPVAWLRDFAASDAGRDHEGLDLPCLILVAEHEVQCRPEDADPLAAMYRQARNVVLPGLSHVLRRTAGPGLGDYARQVRVPMDGAVGVELARWLRGQGDLRHRGLT